MENKLQVKISNESKEILDSLISPKVKSNYVDLAIKHFSKIKNGKMFIDSNKKSANTVKKSEHGNNIKDEKSIDKEVSKKPTLKEW